MYRLKKYSKIPQSERIAAVLRLGGDLFHAKDLANLWQITNANTLHTTLARYVRHGIFHRIYKGFYSTKPIGDIDFLKLGLVALGTYGYVSTETVLAEAGIIQQKLHATTLVSRTSARFSAGGHHYYCRRLQDKYLYNPAGITEKDGVRVASVERAVADLLYFNPKAYFDGYARVDWNAVNKLQQTIDYVVTKSLRRGA